MALFAKSLQCLGTGYRIMSVVADDVFLLCDAEAVRMTECSYSAMGLCEIVSLRCCCAGDVSLRYGCLFEMCIISGCCTYLRHWPCL